MTPNATYHFDKDNLHTVWKFRYFTLKLWKISWNWLIHEQTSNCYCKINDFTKYFSVRVKFSFFHNVDIFLQSSLNLSLVIHVLEGHVNKVHHPSLDLLIQMWLQRRNFSRSLCLLTQKLGPLQQSTFLVSYFPILIKMKFSSDQKVEILIRLEWDLNGTWMRLKWESNGIW